MVNGNSGHVLWILVFTFPHYSCVGKYIVGLWVELMVHDVFHVTIDIWRRFVINLCADENLFWHRHVKRKPKQSTLEQKKYKIFFERKKNNNLSKIPSVTNSHTTTATITMLFFLLLLSSFWVWTTTARGHCAVDVDGKYTSCAASLVHRHRHTLTFSLSLFFRHFSTLFWNISFLLRKFHIQWILYFRIIMLGIQLCVYIMYSNVAWVLSH